MDKNQRSAVSFGSDMRDLRKKTHSGRSRSASERPKARIRLNVNRGPAFETSPLHGVEAVDVVPPPHDLADVVDLVGPGGAGVREIDRGVAATTEQKAVQLAVGRVV